MWQRGSTDAFPAVVRRTSGKFLARPDFSTITGSCRRNQIYMHTKEATKLFRTPRFGFSAASALSLVVGMVVSVVFSPCSSLGTAFTFLGLGLAVLSVLFLVAKAIADSTAENWLIFWVCSGGLCLLGGFSWIWTSLLCRGI